MLKDCPAWVITYGWLIHAEPEMCEREWLCVLRWMARTVNRWLDEVTVKGDPLAQACARWALAHFDAFARFDELASPSPIAPVVVRLRGLCR